MSAKFCRFFSSVGRYEWRALCIFSFVTLSCNWFSVGIMVVVPDLMVSCDGGNYTEDCSVIQNCSSPLQYDHTKFQYSATERYGLICDRSWYKNMAKTVYIFGFFFAAFLSGLLSDRYGRRTVMLVSCTLGFVLNIISIFVDTIVLYLIVRFALGFAHMCFWTTNLIFCMELVSKKKRYLVQLVDSTWFDGTMTIVGLVSFLIKDYIHHHILVTCLYFVSFILIYFFTCESPRWFAARKRDEECHKVVRMIAKYNKRDFEHYDYLHQKDDSAGNQGGLLDLFRTPLIRKRTIILYSLWICVVFLFFGIFFNLNQFTSDVRLGLIVMGAIGIPANFPALTIVNVIGRPLTSFVLAAVSTLLLFAMVPLADDPNSPALTTLAMLGSVTVGSLFGVVYLHTQELFPTVIRQTGLGSCSSMGRIAAMVAPQVALLNVYWPPFTVVTMGLMGTVATLLVPLLPDTTGVELPQSIQDGENFCPDHRYKISIPKRRKRKNDEDIPETLKLNEGDKSDTKSEYTTVDKLLPST